MKGNGVIRGKRAMGIPRKTILVWMIWFVSAFLTGAAGADFQKTKIAVLDFQLQGKGYETEDMGKLVAEWLVTALVKEGRFDVVERRLPEKILNEQKLVMTGVVNESSATKLGKLLGVKVIALVAAVIATVALPPIPLTLRAFAAVGVGLLLAKWLFLNDLRAVDVREFKPGR